MRRPLVGGVSECVMLQVIRNAKFGDIKLNLRIIFILILGVVLAISVASCKRRPLAVNPSEATLLGDLTVRDLDSFAICKDMEKYCVRESVVIRDVFKNQRFSHIKNNLVIVNGKKLAQIIQSARFSDADNLYAVYFLQVNDLDGSGEISDCHACGANLAIAIYQFHNKWKLFDVEHLSDFGAYGEIAIDKGSLRIYKESAARYLITFEDTGGNQGYFYTSRHIIAINTDVRKDLPTTHHQPSIKYIGAVTTGYTECGAKDAGEEWVGEISKIEVDRDSYLSPKIEMLKVVSSCATRRVVRREKIVYEHEKFKNQFVLSAK